MHVHGIADRCADEERPRVVRLRVWRVESRGAQRRAVTDDDDDDNGNDERIDSARGRKGGFERPSQRESSSPFALMAEPQ